MRRIIEIEGVERKINKVTRKPYWITHAIVDDGTPCQGYGKDFDLDDKVEVFYHWGKIKMRKGK